MCFCGLNYSFGWSRVAQELPCLVGSSHVWCFNRGTPLADGEMVGQDLAAEEALCIQGFEHHIQADEFLGKTPPAVIMELAGDMFNGGVLISVLTALFGCMPWGACEAMDDGKLEVDDTSNIQ